MAVRIGGIAYLRVDGNQYPLRGAFTVSPSAIERNGVAGQDQVHGYLEVPRVPFIEGDVSLDPMVSAETLEQVVGATITAELANGKVYVLRDAWCKSALELQTNEGQTRVRFEGIACDEIA